MLFGGVLACMACTHRATLPAPPESKPHRDGYVLKPGDTLDVRFYKTPELNIEVPIRSDGQISLEPLGDVQAAGLEPGELAGILTERYAKELTHPRVTVIVRLFGGQVFVGGEVKTPSVVPFTNGLTVVQAIDAAGGFIDTAARSSVLLIRREGDQYQGYRLAIDKVMTGEDVSGDIALRPSDIIDVPKSRVADVNVFVAQFIRNNLPIQPSMAFGAF